MNEGAEPVAPPAEAAAPTSAAPQKGRMLFPFYAANLLAIYVPSAVPIALEVRHSLEDELAVVNARTIAIDLLASPWAWLRYVVDGGVFVLAGRIGNVGSLYAFLLTLWIGVLLLSIAYCNDKHRYRLTFILFVLSTLQAIFFASQLLEEKQPPAKAGQVEMRVE